MNNNYPPTHPFSDQYWSTSYPSHTSQTDPPPSKKAKTSHPHAVICCDQPCPEDDTLCFQDFCHDFCTDLCQEPCQDLCQDPCQKPCQQTCPDPCRGDCPETIIDHHPDCMDNCTIDCDDDCTLNHCSMDCTTLCDGLDDCVDPTTACLHDCSKWCNPQYSTHCFECMSSPAVSDIRTPQLPHAFDPTISFGNSYSYQTHFPSQSYTPNAPVVPPSTLDTPHVCRVAGCQAGSFKDEDALQDHIEKHHLLKINNRYVCQWEGCVKRVTKKSNDHIEKEKSARALGKTYVPPAEPFSDEHLHKLKRHYYVHSGKKAFECQDCGSVHATKAQLKVHMARHNPKDFRCENCDKVFTTQNQLKTHINAVHKREKHFKCPDCDYACDDSSNMSSHKRKQHQFGVPCPSHIYGCPYKDGRQADMEKHMKMNGHGAWMMDDKDAFEVYWKREKRVAEDERLNDGAQRSSRSHSSRNSVSSSKRRQRKTDHRRTESVSTSYSEFSSRQNTMDSTPAPADTSFDHFQAVMSDSAFQYPFNGL